MKRKLLFIIVGILIAVSVLALPQRVYIAGKFQVAVNVENEQRKIIRNNEEIIFLDTVMADIDLDGLIDKVTRNGGLKIAYQNEDSSYQLVKLSSEDGKIAVYDITGDNIPDILQNAGLGGMHLYANTAMKILTSTMIPISEDGRAYFAYSNYSDSIRIRYFPSIDNINIEIESDEKGIHLLPKANWHGTANLSIAYSQKDIRDTIHCPVVVLPINDPPMIIEQPANIIIQEDGELILFKDSLLNYASDVDSADVLTILSFEDDQFIYCPEKNWNGHDSLIFLISDGKASDTLIQQITVEAVNDAPKWTAIADVEFPEDELLQRPLTWLGEHADDIETPDSLLRFHVYSGEHVSISAEGGKITLIPEENFYGDDKILLTVSDGEFIDTVYWNIHISPVNDAPELAMLPDTVFYEDETILIDRSVLEKFAYDVETPASELKWQVRRFGKVRAHYNGARIRCTASQDWFGTDSLELTVSDGKLTASRIWRVHVLPVNDAPRFEKKAHTRSFLEDDTLVVHKRDLNKLVRDAETASDELMWTLVPSAHLHINENDDDYNIDADPNWFGNAHIRLIVNDGELSDTLDYPLRVLSVNDKPVMQDLDPRTWNEDDTLSIDRSYLERFAEDIETKTNDLMWAFIDDPNLEVKERKNAITLVPYPDWNGNARIGMIIYDGGLRDTGYMDIRIKPVNDAPRWKTLPDTTIAEDGTMILPLSFVRQFVYDPDRGDEIKINYKAGKNFNIEEKADTLVIWPEEDWFGNEKLEFTATDGKKKVKFSWNIPVYSVNDPPYFTMDLPDSISFRANGSDTLLFKDIIYDIDNDLDDLAWEITPGRIVRYMIDDELGGIIFYTENYKFGEDAVTIRVMDGHDMIVYYMPVYVREVDRFLMANPEKLELLPNTPNPFTEYTDIRYSLPVSAHVNIKIYNLLGKEMKTLANGQHDAQNHSVRWWGETESGMPAPSGVYLCRMVAVVDGEPVVIMQKMMLVR
ncbi:MAG: tandem-95 repeat protein [Candidatus Marinimicrobia bacterium]|nr:tandem-95 repeat protein [Candidatus Neomarinimicrobiota bacterium]